MKPKHYKNQLYYVVGLGSALVCALTQYNGRNGYAAIIKWMLSAQWPVAYSRSDMPALRANTIL